MRLGIFAKTFAGATPLEVLSAAKAAGYQCVQYNMDCSGLSALPTDISRETATAVAQAATQTNVQIAAVSATYNMIHPDLNARLKGREAFAAIAKNAHAMGTNLLTVCTGSCDATDQWRHHPDNASEAAWREMSAEFEHLIAIADTFDVYVGIEPELANVVSSAIKARRLLDQFASSRLKIVLDPANLFEVETPQNRQRIIEAAIDLLSGAIVMAHAKDRDAAGGFTAAGAGVIDFAHLIQRLRQAGFDGPLVTHGLMAAQAQQVSAYLAALLQ